MKIIKERLETMNNDLISRNDLIKAVEDLYEYAELGEVIEVIKNAPAITPKVEFVTKNGITFPKALEMMTYSHELTTEERQNIEKAYMLGVYSNEKPRGKWFDYIEEGTLKARNGNYVLYKIDYLLKNLPKKIYLLEGLRRMKGGNK